MNGATPSYLTDYLITNDNPVYNTGASDRNNIRRVRARRFHFFPFCVNEWYKLVNSLRKAKSIKHLKSVLRSSVISNKGLFLVFKQRSLFGIHDHESVNLLSRLRLKYSHLNEHKNFAITSMMVPALCVIVALTLKEETTSSCICRK